MNSSPFGSADLSSEPGAHGLGAGRGKASGCPAAGKPLMLGGDCAREEFELKDGPQGRRRRRCVKGRFGERPSTHP